MFTAFTGGQGELVIVNPGRTLYHEESIKETIMPNNV